MAILEVEHLKKTYTTRLGSNRVEALKDVNFTVERGEFVAIMGESGSGKTTLLNLLAALDKPTGGQVRLNGKNLGELKEKEIAGFRRENLGFVFQDFNLLDTFSLRDNIYLPLVLEGKKYEEMSLRAEPIAKKLGITQILNKYPYEVSGGQKQRAAVARALITNPELVLADEPSGALDSHAADGLMKLFGEINEEGQTIVMVTHSVKAACSAKRVLFIKDGEVFHQLYRGSLGRDEMYQKIVENRSVKDTDARGTAQIVGLSAIKYGDLSNQASKDYVFDVERFTSFEGNTGPYILYTIVRTKSILGKYKEEGNELKKGALLAPKSDSEKALMLSVSRFNGVVEKALMLELARFNSVMENAFEEIAPHKICSYIYDLANEFNHFYHETKILSEQDEARKASYLALLDLVREVLETCIDLLGFSAPERM